MASTTSASTSRGEEPQDACDGATGDASDRNAEESPSPSSPSDATDQLWREVANDLDRSSTVVWIKAVESLDEASRFLLSSDAARTFVEKYMRRIIEILLKQHPARFGQAESDCIEKSLRLCVMIVVNDLESKKMDEKAGECTVLEVLSMVFEKEKNCYDRSKACWLDTKPIGMPELRVRMIGLFRKHNGFAVLADYLSTRIKSVQFPKLEILHPIILATLEANIPQNSNDPDQAREAKAFEDETIRVSEYVMEFVSSASDDVLIGLSLDRLGIIISDLQEIFDRVAGNRPKVTYWFYKVWRALVLKLIESQSLPLMLFGWKQIVEIISASRSRRPPPREYIVAGAGTSFVNGKYEFAGPKAVNECISPYGDVIYERTVADSVPENEGRGKRLTLFPCKMRSQQRWWFLSEADNEQPGTDKDIDYYQHRSKSFQGCQPPPAGWVTCRNGVDPAPTLLPVGTMVPPGEESNTLEHQLAKWAVNNSVMELAHGETIHQDIAARSTLLCAFLADMSVAADPVEAYNLSTNLSRCIVNHKRSSEALDDTNIKRLKGMARTTLDEYLCPITTELPVDPVFAEDGRVYERLAISASIKRQKRNVRSPVTNEAMGPRLFPAIQIRNVIGKLVGDKSMAGDELAESWKRRRATLMEVRNMERRAASNDAEAMYQLGCWHAAGEKDIPIDEEEAYEWFHKALDLDHVRAMAAAGRLCLLGKGTRRGIVYGMHLTTRAEALGSAHAAFTLADAFEEGRHNMPSNIEKAKKLYRQIANGEYKFKDFDPKRRAIVDERLQDLGG